MPTVFTSTTTEKEGVFSVEKNGYVKPETKEYIKDKFFVVRILFFTMGLVHFVPLTFFTTANDYWMYKFRDTSQEEYNNTQNRTSLQSHFAAATTIATNVPLIIFVLLTTTYGHHVKAKLRVYVAIGLMLMCFVISTIFINLDTDSWQTWFYMLSLLLITIINSARAIYRISIFEIISKFPQVSVAWFLAGEGLAGIFNSILQIISLAIGTSTTTSALIYFISGCAVMLFAMVLYSFTERVTYYKHFIVPFAKPKCKKSVGFKEFVENSKLIWSSIVIILFLYIAQLVTSPSITSLVKSEYAGSGPWSDLYFVPVVTFLLNNVCDFLGRTISSKINKTLNGTLITIIMFLRMVIFVPFFMMCNAQPRHHLPVIFNHDYQYIIIVIVFGLSSGYFFNLAFMSIPSLVPKEETECAYHVLVIYVGIIGAAFSVLSFFSVDVI
ncbi:equilibrative nucleoside transporter 3-like [Aethina tumida]|uniref:equilibrative nucleoside transporter 3-like n=1 Tax=Aethina tumida TaxID=116153 RepID=UPI0021491801|nr:equilibrative nucleoside transporter 3-like [Aethina tumida]